MANSEYYNDWKKTVTHSDGFIKVSIYSLTTYPKKKEQESQFQQNAERFFGCTPVDMEVRRQELESRIQEDPKAKVKKQFALDKKQAEVRTLFYS